MDDLVEIYLGEGYDTSLQAIVISVIKENGGKAEHVLNDLDFIDVDVHLFGDVFRLEFDAYSGAKAIGKKEAVSKFASEVFFRQRKVLGEIQESSKNS